MKNEAAGSKKREGNETYARLAALMESGRDRKGDDWENEAKSAFREYLVEGKPEAKPVLHFLEQLSPGITGPELAAAWMKLPTKVREKLSDSFRQKAALIGIVIHIAGVLAKDSASSDAAVLAKAALFALQKPPSTEVRKWVERGGLVKVMELVLTLRDQRDQLGDLAGSFRILIAVAEGLLAASPTRLVRSQVEDFAKKLRSHLESGDVAAETAADLTSRLSEIEQKVAIITPDKLKHTDTRENLDQDRPPLTAPNAEEPPKPSSDSVTKQAESRRGASATLVPRSIRLGEREAASPRAVIESLSSIVALLEELETRRTEQESIAASERRSVLLESQVQGLRADLTKERDILTALKSRVVELEEKLRLVRDERDSARRDGKESAERLDEANRQIQVLQSEQNRLVVELPKQRLSEFQRKLYGRLKPILDEIDEFQGQAALSHEAQAFLDRYRALKEILAEEQLSRA